MRDEKTSTNYNEQFYKYLNKLAKLKKDYEDIVSKGGLSKEINRRYKDNVKILEENLIKLHPHIENKRKKILLIIIQ